MNTLYIDTRNNEEIIVSLESENKVFEEKSVVNKNRAQETLPLIEKVLKKAGLKISQIDEFKAERGPGSFTGLRVGLSIANALSFALLKKINNNGLGGIEIPDY